MGRVEHKCGKENSPSAVFPLFLWESPSASWGGEGALFSYCVCALGPIWALVSQSSLVFLQLGLVVVVTSVGFCKLDPYLGVLGPVCLPHPAGASSTFYRAGLSSLTYLSL